MVIKVDISAMMGIGMVTMEGVQVKTFEIVGRVAEVVNSKITINTEGCNIALACRVVADDSTTMAVMADSTIALMVRETISMVTAISTKEGTITTRAVSTTVEEAITIIIILMTEGTLMTALTGTMMTDMTEGTMVTEVVMAEGAMMTEVVTTLMIEETIITMEETTTTPIKEAIMTEETNMIVEEMTISTMGTGTPTIMGTMRDVDVREGGTQYGIICEMHSLFEVKLDVFHIYCNDCRAGILNH